jgi:cytochrome b561
MHWLVVALVLAQLGLGVYAADLPVSLARLQWLSRHKSLGLAILAVIAFRIAWRSMNRPPPLPASIPAWQHRAARAVHWTLYALLVLAPLTGWLHASAAGLSVNWFGLFQVPDPIPQNQALAVLFKDVHRTCVALLALLIVGHAGAALWHAFVLRDGVLHRMLPWKSRNS